LWERYGKPLPVRCPYCGFAAVTPDLSCMVCGRSVDEEDLKEYIDLKGLLQEYARRSPRQLVLEIYRSGFVIYDGELYPPSLKSRAPLGVVLYLSRDEKELISRILSEES